MEDEEEEEKEEAVEDEEEQEEEEEAVEDEEEEAVDEAEDVDKDVCPPSACKQPRQKRVLWIACDACGSMDFVLALMQSRLDYSQHGYAVRTCKV